MDDRDEIRQPDRGTIVFVDDMPQLLAIATKMLDRLGYRTTGFTSASEALAHIREHHADTALVITDQSMPEMTGLDLVHCINDLDNPPPVVLATSLYEPKRAGDYLAMGVTALLSKPFSIEDLKTVVTRTLSIEA